MLFISHNLNVVRKLCRRVAVMQRGVLVEEGDTDQVFYHPQASLDPALIASVLKENGLVPVAKLAAFRDPIAARTDRNMAIGYTGQAYLWLDNKASAGGSPWLNPYSDEAVRFIGDLIGEVQSMGSVSYTHLDVYKRQCTSSPTPSRR